MMTSSPETAINNRCLWKKIIAVKTRVNKMNSRGIPRIVTRISWPSPDSAPLAVKAGKKVLAASQDRRSRTV
jgi:hypothetical protein